jgi:hypothetical protein
VIVYKNCCPQPGAPREGSGQQQALTADALRDKAEEIRKQKATGIGD